MIGKDGLLRVRSCDSNAACYVCGCCGCSRIGVAARGSAPFKLGLLSVQW